MALAVLHGQAEVARAQEPPTTRELLAIINERAKADATRIDVQEKANNARFDAQEKAVAAALAASDRAVTKAEDAQNKKNESTNEFRGQLKDQAATLSTRTEVDIRFKSIEDKIAANTLQITQQVSRAEGVAQIWGVMTVVVGLVLTGLMALIALRKRPA